MKQLFLTTVFLLCTLSNYAQEQPPKPPSPPKFEKIKALKTAHITNVLDLSEKEAEKFWPIYNQSEKKIHVLRKKTKQLRKKAIENLDQLSEVEAKKIIIESIALEHQIQNEKEVMFKNVMRVLSAKKALQLQKSEHEFNRKLLRKMKGKRKSHPKRNRQ